jgi:hypothetical protein
METIQIILGVVIGIITFAVKNWADMKAAKKAIFDTIEKLEDIKADGTITEKEKQEFAEQAIQTLQVVIPVLINIWKFNWKKKRTLKNFLSK